jgi:hypothetical protein
VDTRKAKFIDVQGKGTKPNYAYFICDDPHFEREYPKRENLNAIRVGDNNEDEGVVTHVNHIRVLNCLVAELVDSASQTSLVDQDLARIDAL